jgi:hypothetical protein
MAWVILKRISSFCKFVRGFDYNLVSGMKVG